MSQLCTEHPWLHPAPFLTWLTRSAESAYFLSVFLSSIVQSKRHSRNLSQHLLLPNQSPPPVSRPNGLVRETDIVGGPTPSSLLPYPTNHSPPETSTSSSPNTVETLDFNAPPRSQSTPIKSSTFRRLPLRKAQRTPVDQTPTHSHNTSVSSLQAPMHSQDTSVPSLLPRSNKGSKEVGSTPAVLPGSLEPLSIPSIKVDTNPHHPAIPSPVSKSSSLKSDVSTPNKPTPSVSRKQVPHLPGFQPGGVVRVLTDDFLSARRMKREAEGEGGMKRVERTKLERRLEKIINLHFPFQPDSNRSRDGLDEKSRPSGDNEHRRASSIFDFQTLKHINFNDANGLWKGVVNGGLRDTTKVEIRGWHLFKYDDVLISHFNLPAAEQRITPWEDDATVSRCPLCA